MNMIKVFNTIEDSVARVAVKVYDPNASLEDLLQAWQPLCDDPSIFKEYAADNHASCEGCRVNCCNSAYIVPDLISFKKTASLQGLSYEELINKYFDAEKSRNGLLRLKHDPCIFLKDNRCSIYTARSLTCRFYICTHLAGDTEQLIYKISCVGAAATQLFAEQKGLIKAQANSVLSSFDRLFMELVDKYRSSELINLFLQADDYKDIKIKPFLEIDTEN